MAYLANKNTGCPLKCCQGHTYTKKKLITSYMKFKFKWAYKI